MNRPEWLPLTLSEAERLLRRQAVSRSILLLTPPSEERPKNPDRWAWGLPFWHLEARDDNPREES